METARILVVDDEPSWTEALKRLLEQQGQFDVETVNDATKAVSTVRRFRPDLILLDVIMPDISGGQIAEELKQDQELREIPILFLTAVLSKEEAETRSGEIGGHQFLAKPIRAEELMSRIVEILCR